MAIGDYFSNMFFGNTGESPGAQKASQELWKIYQQAYNVKPVWNGKAWVIPPGAVQRFQMLLPLIQAQMRSGAGAGQGNDKGILAPMLTKGISGLGNKALDSMGGWGGIYDKIAGGVKGLWDSIGGSPSPESFSPIDNQGEDWWSGQPDNTTMPIVDPNQGVTNDDWWSNQPGDTSSSLINDDWWSGAIDNTDLFDNYNYDDLLSYGL